MANSSEDSDIIDGEASFMSMVSNNKPPYKHAAIVKNNGDSFLS